MEEERLQEHSSGETDEPEAERKPPQSETLAKQMAKAKEEILRQRKGLSEDNRKAVEEKLTEANKALSNFSHGKLIKSIEEQQKTLKDELISIANISENDNKEKANKAAFNNAVQTYLNKRLELARARLQEIATQDKQSIKAQREICTQFYTPEGKTESEDVINKLGNEFSYIERQEGTVFKSRITVKCVNGVYTSSSPPDLALTIKAKGHNSFKFTGARANHTGAEHLIESIEEMLKVGIKNITIDDKLWEKMFRSPQQRYSHSSGDYAAQLVQYMKGVKDHQKNRLKQLRRICAASTSAYSDMKGNPVFKEDGTIKSGAESVPDPILHQINTFMRLHNDTDRKEYLHLIFPSQMGNKAAKFVEELEKRGVKTVGTTGLSPKDYMNKMLGFRALSDFLTEVSDRRSEFKKEHDRIEKLKTFNEPKKDFDQLKKTFLDTNDEILLRRYARSDKLKGPNDNPNQLRIELVKAAFNDIQAPKNPADPANPKTPLLQPATFSSKFSVHEDDQRPFLLKALALYENIKVLKANGDIDYPATLRAKSQLLEDLRDIAEDHYTDQKNPPHNNPKAFDHFYANKILLDQLEIKMIEKHLNEFLSTIKAKQRDAKREEAIAQHLSRYNDISDSNLKKNYFAYRIGPQFQQKIWNDMFPVDPQTAEQRARILAQAIALYEEHPTPSALHFVNTLIEPLMKAITRELTPKELVDIANREARDKGLPEKKQWKDEELAPIKQAWAQDQSGGSKAMTALTEKLSEVCLNNNVHGTKTAQNRILSCIRECITRLGAHLEPAVTPILSKSLFKEYFNQNPGPNSDKLMELMQCYGQVRRELSGPRRFMQDYRFKDEMRELLFHTGQETPSIGKVLDDLYQRRNEANIDKETQYFIDQLDQLRTQFPAPGRAPRPQAGIDQPRSSIHDRDEGFNAPSPLDFYDL